MVFSMVSLSYGSDATARVWWEGCLCADLAGSSASRSVWPARYADGVVFPFGALSCT